jgi:hypothetical protein
MLKKHTYTVYTVYYIKLRLFIIYIIANLVGKLIIVCLLLLFNNFRNSRNKITTSIVLYCIVYYIFVRLLLAFFIFMLQRIFYLY